MYDYYFEKEFRRIKRAGYCEYLEETYKNTLERIRLDGVVKHRESVYNLLSFLDIYFEDKYPDGSSELYDNEYDRFCEAFSKENMIEFAKRYQFTEDEINYIKSNICNGNFDGYEKASEVFFIAKLIDYFGIDVLKDLLNRRQDLFKKNNVSIQKYSQLFSDRPYGEDIKTKLDDAIDKKVDWYVNDGINCGGYALKIDYPVFPCGNNFSQMVTRVLDEFPFTRLLGETDLKDDEYLVIYRARKEGGFGHHFIRVDDDGIVREKDGAKPYKIFEGWNNWLEEDDVCEAFFAVKKDHKMFGVERKPDSKLKLLDFSQTVGIAIEEKSNEFSYHNHVFRFKKSEDGEIIVIDEKGKFIADVVAEDGQCLVEVSDDKMDYVENVKSRVKPIIENGVLINFDEFKERKKDVSDEGR